MGRNYNSKPRVRVIAFSGTPDMTAKMAGHITLSNLIDHVDELIASSLLESGEVLSIHFCANVRILPQYVYCKTTLIFKRKSLVGEEGLTSLCMHYTCNHFGCSLLSACEVCSCSRLRHIHLYPRLGYIGVPITSLSAMHIVTFSVSI